MRHIFIINPYAGKMNFAEELRLQLKEIEGLDYFVFNTRYAGYETELAGKLYHMFPDEELRFYACGGSGTMRNIMNGIPDLSKVEIAMYPCGMTNDFLKCFQPDDAKRFYDLTQLIHGETIQVDYLKTTNGCALNTCTTGFDEGMLRIVEEYRNLSLINGGLPYMLAALNRIFTGKAHRYEVTVDDMVIEDDFIEVLFQNGKAFGGSMYFIENPDPSDGKLDVALIHGEPGIRTIWMLFAAYTKNFKAIQKNGYILSGKEVSIRIKDENTLWINHDGEVVNGDREWKICIVPRGLRLVVPKGVRL